MYVKYPEVKVMSDETRREEETNRWCYDSHCWSEQVYSISKCVWCGHEINGYQGVNLKNIPLCKENPKVKELLK